jgi:hypothetical protein
MGKARVYILPSSSQTSLPLILTTTIQYFFPMSGELHTTRRALTPLTRGVQIQCAYRMNQQAARLTNHSLQEGEIGGAHPRFR